MASGSDAVVNISSSSLAAFIACHRSSPRLHFLSPSLAGYDKKKKKEGQDVKFEQTRGNKLMQILRGNWHNKVGTTKDKDRIFERHQDQIPREHFNFLFRHVSLLPPPRRFCLVGRFVSKIAQKLQNGFL